MAVGVVGEGLYRFVEIREGLACMGGEGGTRVAGVCRRMTERWGLGCQSVSYKRGWESMTVSFLDLPEGDMHGGRGEVLSSL